MKNKNLHGFLTIFVLTLTLFTTRLMAQPAPVYPTEAPTIEASQVLSFTWDNVDKYPLTTSLAFIATKNMVVTGGDDCQICVWSLENGALLNHFVADVDWIRSISLSPDESTLAALGHNGSIKLWNTEDWSVRKELSKAPTGSEGIAYSPTGTKLAICGFENKLTLYDPETGKADSSATMPSTGNFAIEYSPDGKLLAAAGRNGVIRVWTADGMKSLYDLETSGRRIIDLAFSPDGSLLAAGGEESEIYVFDTATGKKVKTISTGIGKTFSLCFCGGDILASGDSLNSIRIWNLEDGTEIGRCLGHTGTVAAMYFDHEKGELVSGGFDTTVRCWPLTNE